MSKENDYLEELWMVKNDMSARFSSFRDFFNDMMNWQHGEEEKGKDYVRLPLARVYAPFTYQPAQPSEPLMACEG